MKKALRAKNIYLCICILCSILFVLGIPLIIMGAQQDNKFLLGLGIAFTAIDFYAVPILWTSLPHYVENYRIAYAIEAEKIYSVSQLAMHFSTKEDHIKLVINTCIQKGYLYGFLFDGTKITENYNLNNVRYVTETCHSCGAPYYHKSNEVGICPYCHTPSKKIVFTQKNSSKNSLF